MSDLTLIIPAKNEKESLPKVLDELKEFNLEKTLYWRHQISLLFKL